MAAEERNTANARAQAEELLKAGMFNIFRAFNMTDDPARSYSFDLATIEAATVHCRELTRLLLYAPIEERRAPLAQGDAAFQRFMVRAVAPVKTSRADTRGKRQR